MTAKIIALALVIVIAALLLAIGFEFALRYL